MIPDRHRLVRVLAAAVATFVLVALGAAIHPLAAAAVAASVTLAALLLIAGRRDGATRLADAPASGEAPPPPVPPALVAALPDPALLLDAGGHVVAANEAASTLLERSSASMAGQPLIAVAWRSELVAVAEAADGGTTQLELPGGRVVLATAVPLTGFEGGPRLLVLREITALRRAERARTELVANFSHELRTPIAAARVLAETLEGGVEDVARRTRYEHQLLEQLDRLASMVERLLRLSRIETGGEPIEPARVEPRLLLDTAAARIAPLAEARGVAIAVGEVAAPAVRADAARVLEVLAILLDNAVRFSPPGGTVTLAARGLEGEAQFEVRDAGPGILPHERERVFERFYTGDRSRAMSDERGGAGLGLAIARHLVERHGGRIHVADESPGAILRFTLPLAGSPAD